MAKTKWKPELKNLGSLITYQDEQGNETCLGSLLVSDQHGTFDPNIGRVDVTREQADIHNKLLDEALIKGLDESCQVGQGGGFYIDRASKVAKTWTGIFVANLIGVFPVVSFVRNGKSFRGRIPKDSDYVFFKRIA